MQQLHTQFLKKSQYHQQKAYLELKDVYWLVHEFFSTFLGKESHFTEEELTQELQSFKHEFVALPPQVVESWKAFFENLSRTQYSGAEPSQEQLKSLLDEFGSLVAQTVGKDYAPSDAFTRKAQEAHVLLKHGELEKAESIYKVLMSEYEGYSTDAKRTHFEQLDRLYRAIALARSGIPASPQQ